jgi:hypothetical protein
VLLKDPNRGWRKSGAPLAVTGGGLQQARDAFVALLKAQVHQQVADFDDHLDDISKWVSEPACLVRAQPGACTGSRAWEPVPQARELRSATAVCVSWT